MSKKLFSLASVLWLCSTSVFVSDTYVVQKNDSLWKIAVKYQVGVIEIIQTNPQFEDPNLIYPGQKVFVPHLDEIKMVEQEVIRLANERRAQTALVPTAEHWGSNCCVVSHQQTSIRVGNDYLVNDLPTCRVT